MATTTHPHVASARGKLDALIASYREGGRLRLPRETDLSAELGISRNTLREALARLEANGVIERRRRLGTFITQMPTSDAEASSRVLSYPIDEIVSIAGFLEGTGTPFSIRSVAVGQELASATIVDRLGLVEGDFVYRVRRVYDSEGTAVAIGEHLIPTVLRGRQIKIEALTYGVSTFLDETEHIPIEVVEHTVIPMVLDTQLAQEFQLPAGSPALLVEAELKTRELDRYPTVAFGRLIFNPARVRVHATGHAIVALTQEPSLSPLDSISDGRNS